MLLLYPEDTSHMLALEKIKLSYDYALILHNKDVFTPEDELLNPEHKSGTLKKEHYHCVLRCKNAQWNTSICNDLGIKENYIEETKSIDNALLYLIHFNEPNKTQYDLNEVKGPLKNKIKELINKVDKSEGEKVSELITFIESLDHPITIKEFAFFCANNGYWSEFRRSATIFCRIIDEHNTEFY